MAGQHREGDSMTARRAGTTLALLAASTVLVAACSGAASTSAPTTAPTSPPVTQAPPTDAAPSQEIPGFSFALPSFTSDEELKAMFPTEVGGQPIVVLTMTGTDFVGLPTASKDIETALHELGKSPSDLSVGSGGNALLAIIAFRVKGVPADKFLGKYINSTAAGSTVTDASFGGKPVKKVVSGGRVAAYLYLKGDVLWTVSGNNLSDALLTEAFSKLP
jgi:hypothetical protein